MEYLLATAIGVMTAAGIYLLTYAVNLFLFASGRVAINLPPVLLNQTPTYTDPLPQALVLTAIVISFGMTAVVVLMGLGAFLSARTDHIDLARTGDQAEESGK